MMKTKLKKKENDDQALVGQDKGRAPKAGDLMKDGTIYAGASPETGEALYVTPQSAMAWKWKQAMKYAEGLDVYGHNDWRLPTRAELRTLFENQHKGALKGTFREDGIYWSLTRQLFPLWFFLSDVTVVDFTDGYPDWVPAEYAALRSFRPVRMGPHP